MMLYNYDNLLSAVREIKTNKTIAENERTNIRQRQAEGIAAPE